MIDGVLNEPAWQQAAPLANFVQAEPFEGQPASEDTEVRILYDDDAIYVGVMLRDSDPSQIVTTDTRRDAELNEMDSFQIIFDTFRDQQNGFVFGTNAQGVQYDGQVRDQGNTSASWDGSWEVKTSTTDTGWSAEFRIPLRLAAGYLPKNGPFFRLSAGVEIPLGRGVHLGLDLIAPALWIIRNRTLLSIDVGAEVGFDL